METLILGDSIIKYQPTVLNDDHLLKINVKCFPGINIAKLHVRLDHIPNAIWVILQKTT